MSESSLQITAIVPVKDRAELLDRCLRALVRSAAGYGNARIIVCDNGSTDDSANVASRQGSRVTVVHSTANRVGGVRNDGAAAASSADALAFVDCDCLVPEDFFQAVADTFLLSGAAVVGCEVVSKLDGHWTERVWDKLHRPGGDGPRHYINSACFCIRSDWFKRINGFDQDKVSSEDVDICRRLASAGGTMWQSERLAILHLGNPQSVSGLYKRLRWHGEGVWEQGKGFQWSVTSIATLLHCAFLVIGLLSGIALFMSGWALGGLVVCVVGFLIVPALFVLARGIQHKRRVPIIGGIALMSITFPARFHGLLRSIFTAHRN